MLTVQSLFGKVSTNKPPSRPTMPSADTRFSASLIKAEAAETIDTILGGALAIRQPENGYRFRLDSILLARFASVRPRDRVLELGAGGGVISIVIAAPRHPK